jgi:hypothetical protein
MTTQVESQQIARPGNQPFKTGDATSARLVGIVALLLTVLTINMTNAQGQTNRKWAIDFRPETGTLHMMLGIDGGAEHGRNEKYFNVPLEQLPGLTKEQITSADAEVKFRLTRDAGTFDCTGRFHHGNGAGSFTFVANPDFAARVRAQGFGELSEESELLIAIYNIDSEFVRDARTDGGPNLTVEQLIKKGMQRTDENDSAARIPFNAPPPGARAQAGGTDFVSGLEALGYDRPSAHQLSAMSTQGVTLDFIKEMNQYFSTRPTIDQLIGIRTQGINADYVKGLASLGYSGLSAHQLICLRVRGVSIDYIRRTQAETGGRPSLRKLIQLRDPYGTAVGDCGPEAFPDE